MANSEKNIFGILARFRGPGELLHAAEKIRDAGYKKFDCHSPFPIHGMDQAMGLTRSPLGWICGLLALLGGSGLFALMWWTMSVDYPLIISGKPYFAFQAYVPITFAGAVIGAAFGAVVGMLVINRLPRLHHPLFASDKFVFADDGFFVSIEADDSAFDKTRTVEFLKSIGADDVEVIES